MKDATHFIEQFKTSEGMFNTVVKPIAMLKSTLNGTNICCCKTIAVWFIKPKLKTIIVSGEEFNGQTILIAE